MSNSIEQQAADILDRFWASRERTLSALNRAGLLVSERDVLCRKLADALFAYMNAHPNSNIQLVSLFRNAIPSNPSPQYYALKLAHDALAAYDREHAPKPRYVVEDIYVKDTVAERIVGMGDSAQNAAMLAALNALAEKEAGR